jgi:hypothetical protein
MRLLMWYCKNFSWVPAIKTLPDAPEAKAGEAVDCVVAFIHVEPGDDSYQETKLVKNIKWLCKKWETKSVLLHSFTHLGEKKAEPEAAKIILEAAFSRLVKAGLTTTTTPYGYFLDLTFDTPGHPLSRVYKEFSHTNKETSKSSESSESSESDESSK